MSCDRNRHFPTNPWRPRASCASTQVCLSQLYHPPTTTPARTPTFVAAATKVRKDPRRPTLPPHPRPRPAVAPGTGHRAILMPSTACVTPIPATPPLPIPPQKTTAQHSNIPRNVGMFSDRTAHAPSTPTFCRGRDKSSSPFPHQPSIPPTTPPALTVGQLANCPTVKTPNPTPRRALTPGVFVSQQRA